MRRHERRERAEERSHATLPPLAGDLICPNRRGYRIAM
jgi:hypothetical protein